MAAAEKAAARELVARLEEATEAAATVEDSAAEATEAAARVVATAAEARAAG